MRELIHRKDSLVAQRATPAYFMQVSSVICQSPSHSCGAYIRVHVGRAFV